DEQQKLKALQAERDRDYAIKLKEMEERKADREADIKWRQQQFETEQGRYADTQAEKQANEVGLDQRVDDPTFQALYAKHPAASQFRTIPGQAAAPAWEAPAEGDAMPDAGPATPAVPMAHMRNPNQQEQLALRSIALSEQA